MVKLVNEMQNRHTHLSVLSLLLSYLVAPAHGQTCRICPVDHYCPGTEQIPCPVNSRSNAGSRVVEACVCAAGAGTGSEGGACTACAAGKYKDEIGSKACTECAANTYSTTIAANSSDVCLSCPSGTYFAQVDTPCINCPVNMGSAALSTSINNCTCLRGFTVFGDGEVSTHQLKLFVLLQNIPPVGVHFFADYDISTKNVPDIRGYGLGVSYNIEQIKLYRYPDDLTGGNYNGFDDMHSMTLTMQNSNNDNSDYQIKWSSNHNDYLFAYTPANVVIKSTKNGKFKGGNYENGLYIGTNNTLVDSSDDRYYGDWISVKYPECFAMTSSQMIPRSYSEHASPGKYRIYARMNDIDEWVIVHIQDSPTSTVDEIVQLNKVFDVCYFEYALVVNELFDPDIPSDLLQFNEWSVKGTSPFTIEIPYNTIHVEGSGILLYPDDYTKTTTALFGGVDTMWTSPDLNSIHTVCWASRYREPGAQQSSDWDVSCAAKDQIGSVRSVTDQFDIDTHSAAVHAVTYATKPQSENWVHSIYTWDTALSNEEMKSVTAGIRNEIGGIPYMGTNSVNATTNFTAYYLRLLSVLNDQPLCTACAAGQYKDEIGLESCTECAANTYSSATGDVCVSCPPNSSSIQGSSNCICNPGSYMSTTGDCIGCARGSFWSDPGVVPNTVLSIPHDASGTVGPRFLYTPERSTYVNDGAVVAGGAAVSDGLVLHFPFDYQSETQANVAPSGPEAELRLDGMVTIQEPGVVGAGHSTVVNGDYSPITLEGDVADILSGITKFTVSSWVRFGEGVYTRYLLFGSDVVDYLIRDGGIQVLLRTQDQDVPYAYTDDGGPFEHDTWYHLTFAANVSTKNPSVTVYVNGELSFRYDPPAYNLLGFHEMRIGTSSSGSIDDFRLYDRMLSANEVELLYNHVIGSEGYNRTACVDAVTAVNGPPIPHQCWLTTHSDQTIGAWVGVTSYINFDFFCTDQTARVKFMIYAYGPDSGSDSLWLKVDDESSWGYLTGFTRTESSARWNQHGKEWSLSSGVHTLRVGIRETDTHMSHVRFSQGAGSCYFYKDGDPSMAVCTQCAEGSSTIEAWAGDAHQCTAICPAGTDSEGGVCTVCATGKYKDEGGLEACTECAANTYSATTGANSSDVCLNCPEKTESVSGSINPNDCLCKPGWYGSWIDGNNSTGGNDIAPTCVPCEVGSWCFGGVNYSCPVFSSSAAESDHINDCKCTAGFYGPGSSCEKCPENTISLEGSRSGTDCVAAPPMATITFTATIPLTTAEFLRIQEVYIDGVASALSLDARAVSVVDIATELMSRRLLQSSVNVVTAVVAEASIATNVSTSITSGVLEVSLNASGISISNISPPKVIVDNVGNKSKTSATGTIINDLIEDIWDFVSTGWNPVFVSGGVFVFIILIALLIYASCHCSQPTTSIQFTPGPMNSPFLSNYKMLLPDNPIG